MDDLSTKQIEIMRYIEEYIHGKRCPPTNREIGAQFDIKSTGHVDYHLSILEERGYISREAKKSRSIRVLRPSRPAGLPIYGTIAAGSPLDINQAEPQGMLDLSIHEPDNSGEFVLQVRGKSMIEDHIDDGDYVVILPNADVRDGDIIVATHKTATGDLGAATLKRIYKERTGIRLQPANSEMKPIRIKAHEWEQEWMIQGKVTAVYRRCAY